MDDNREWEEFRTKYLELITYGLENGYIGFYPIELIEQLRDIYEGGVPASIILLSNALSNGHCYDRALLLARAFLDTEDDVKLIYASVDSLRLNPSYSNLDYDNSDHCFLERITKEGEDLIYDTSTGFVYQKDIYWEIEHPTVRRVNNKQAIKNFLETDPDKEHLGNKKYDDFVTLELIIPYLENTYGNPRELYTHDFYPALQQEIEYFKSLGISENIKERVK